MNVPMHDGVYCHSKKTQGESPLLLVFPDVGESVQDYSELQQMLNNKTQLIELRGHSLSQGNYSLENHWHDMQYWILHAKQTEKDVYVLAKGVSAYLLLLLENQAHEQLKTKVLPDGMVLLDPKNVPKVRLQTPTKIVLSTSQKDKLHKLKGNCITRIQPSIENNLQRHIALKKLQKDIHYVMNCEKPIRFRTSK